MTSPPFASAQPASLTYYAEIIRDGWGVPHIYGDTDAATSFGLAFAQAEDDMDSIENAVLWSRGRLSSKLGAAALDQDRFSHLLQGDRIARSVYQRDIPLGLQEILEGYAAGVNHYLDKHPEEGRCLDRPVEPQDLVAFWYMITPMFFGLQRDLNNFGEQLEVALGLDLGDKNLGSNGVAVSAGRAADGVTRLFSNSHQPWEGMLAWYECGVHSKEGLEFYGGSFPATPFPIMGHNAELGWTYTLNRPQLTDIYRLELHPDDPRLYRFETAWKPMEVYPVAHQVKTESGFEQVDETVEWTVHGPVVRAGSQAYALRYASIGEATSLVAPYTLIRSHNFEDWQAAYARQASPSVNTVYADRDGNVGYFYNARHPDRSSAFLPGSVLPGDRPEALWSGYLPSSGNPRVINPAAGYVFSANNSPFLVTAENDNLSPRDFAAALRIETTETNRGQRLFELMAQQEVLDRQAILDIKFDCKVSRETAGLDAYLQSAAAARGALAEAARLIETWDRSFDHHSPGAALATLLCIEFELAREDRRAPKPAPVVLAAAAAHLQATFGSLDPKMGDLVRLRRGALDTPVTFGGPDVLRAINAYPQPDGRFRAEVGDSLMMLIEWGKDGRVQTHALNPYGQAMSRPDSPHYCDQAERFLRNDLRAAWFYREDVEAHAVRRYAVGLPSCPT